MDTEEDKPQRHRDTEVHKEELFFLANQRSSIVIWLQAKKAPTLQKSRMKQLNKKAESWLVTGGRMNDYRGRYAAK